MIAEHVDRLKREYTDKYVVVDANRPELARFKGVVGRVKTVNMSGRALVQFDANSDRGWYDIPVDCLRVVEPPPPKPVEKKPAAAAKAKAAPATSPEKKAAEENKPA